MGEEASGNLASWWTAVQARRVIKKGDQETVASWCCCSYGRQARRSHRLISNRVLGFRHSKGDQAAPNVFEKGIRRREEEVLRKREPVRVMKVECDENASLDGEKKC